MELANGEFQESPKSENEIKVQRVEPLYLDVASQALKNTYLHSQTNTGGRAFKTDRSCIPLFETSGLEKMIAEAIYEKTLKPYSVF